MKNSVTGWEGRPEGMAGWGLGQAVAGKDGRQALPMLFTSGVKTNKATDRQNEPDFEAQTGGSDH